MESIAVLMLGATLIVEYGVIFLNLPKGMYQHIIAGGLICIILLANIFFLTSTLKNSLSYSANPLIIENSEVARKKNRTFFNELWSNSMYENPKQIHEVQESSESQEGYSYLRVSYEIAPRNLTIIKGFFVKGTPISMYRSDGKYVEIKSEQYNTSQVIDVLLEFDANVSGNLTVKMSFTNNVTVHILLYNYTDSSFQAIYNTTNATKVEDTITINGAGVNPPKFRVCVSLDSGDVFYMSVDYFLYKPKYENIVQMSYRFLSSSELEYCLEFYQIPCYTKIFMENLSEYLSIVDVFPTDVIWNYSERSVILKDGGLLRLRFKGYDYWSKTGNINLTVELECGGLEVKPSEIQLMRKLRYFRFVADNGSFYFAKRIVIKNPSQYDLYNVSVKLILNDSWFNMLQLGEDALRIRFYDITLNEVRYSIPAYLDYWDGKTAIYYIKLPVIYAFEEKTIEIRYGNPSFQASTQKCGIDKMGPITSMENLSNKYNWIVINGRVAGTYDDIYNESILAVQNGTEKKSLFHLRYNLSGSIRTSFLIKTYSIYLLDDNYSLEFYPFFVDNDTFYKLEIRNYSSGYIILSLFFRNGTYIETIDSKIIPVNNPYGMKIELINNFSVGEAMLKVIIDYDTTPREYYFYLDKYYDVSRKGWKIAYGSFNVGRYYIIFYSWIHKRIKKLWIQTPVDEDFFVNGTTIWEYETNWEILDSEYLVIPNNAEVLIRAYDIFNNTILNITDFDVLPESPIIQISLNASWLYLNNSKGAPKVVEIWLNGTVRRVNVGTGEVYRLILAKKTYYLRSLSAGNINFECVITLENDTSLLLRSWSNLADIVDKNENLNYIYQCVEDQNSPDIYDDIYFMAVNYSKIKEYISKTLEYSWGRIYKYWNSSYESINNDINTSVEIILKALNIQKTLDVYMVNIICAGELLKVMTYYSDGTQETFFLNSTMEDIINIMRENLTHLYKIIKFVVEVLDDNCSIHEISLDSHHRYVSIKFANGERIVDVQVDAFDQILNINSSFLDLISTLGSTLRLILLANTIANKYISILEKDDKLYFSLNLNNGEMGIHIHCSKYKPSYISIVFSLNAEYYTIQDEKGNILAVLNMEHNVLWGTNTTLDIGEIRFDILFQKIFNGLILRTIDRNTDAQTSAISWIQNNIITRKIKIIDFYTGDDIQSTELAENILVKVNGSSFYNDEFKTLAGALFIEIYDIWDTLIWSGEIRNSTITIELKFGALVVLNDLDLDVILNVSPKCSEKWISWHIDSRSILSILLSVGRKYDIVLYTTPNMSTIYECEVDYNISENTSKRPLVIFFLSNNSDANEEQQEVESDVSNNVNNTNNSNSNSDGSGNNTSSNTDAGGGLGATEQGILSGINSFLGSVKWHLILALLFILVCVVAKRIIGRFKQRRVIPVEKILEKVLENSENDEG